MCLFQNLRGYAVTLDLKQYQSPALCPQVKNYRILMRTRCSSNRHNIIMSTHSSSFTIQRNRQLTVTQWWNWCEEEAELKMTYLIELLGFSLTSFCSVVLLFTVNKQIKIQVFIWTLSCWLTGWCWHMPVIRSKIQLTKCFLIAFHSHSLCLCLLHTI